MNDNDDARLNQLKEQLKADGWNDQNLTYRDLWLGALNGLYPAHQRRGRWYFNPKNTPLIARALRLRRAAPSSARALHTDVAA